MDSLSCLIKLEILDQFGGVLPPAAIAEAIELDAYDGDWNNGMCAWVIVACNIT